MNKERLQAYCLSLTGTTHDYQRIGKQIVIMLVEKCLR